MPAIVPAIAPKAASGAPGWPRRRLRAAPISSALTLCFAIAAPPCGAAAAGRRSKLVSAIAIAVAATRVDFIVMDDLLELFPALAFERCRKRRSRSLLLTCSRMREFQ